MSLANKPAFPNITPDMDIQGGPGMTLLEHYVGLPWTNDEIESVIGTSVTSCAEILGINAADYDYRIHYKKACAIARIQLAKALIAELEKESV